MNEELKPNASRSLREHFHEAFKRSRAWCPVSFYLLLATPVVLLFSVHMLRQWENPKRFALVLALLFIFLGILVYRALMDILYISCKNLAEQRQAYKETLGSEKFVSELGNRVDEEKNK